MTVEQDRPASAESSRFRRNVSRKGAKARPKPLTRLCVFAIFAPLREKPSQNFNVCLDAKKSFHASPFFFKSSGTFVMVKSSIFTPFEICGHVSGIDTVAFGFARAVNTAAKLLPRAFCIQST